MGVFGVCASEDSFINHATAVHRLEPLHKGPPRQTFFDPLGGDRNVVLAENLPDMVFLQLKVPDVPQGVKNVRRAPGGILQRDVDDLLLDFLRNLIRFDRRRVLLELVFKTAAPTSYRPIANIAESPAKFSVGLFSAPGKLFFVFFPPSGT